MKIDLTPHLKHYVAEKVKDGRYGNPSDVVREALRQMERREDSGANPELRRLLRAGLRAPLRRWKADEMSRRLKGLWPKHAGTRRHDPLRARPRYSDPCPLASAAFGLPTSQTITPIKTPWARPETNHFTARSPGNGCTV